MPVQVQLDSSFSRESLMQAFMRVCSLFTIELWPFSLSIIGLSSGPIVLLYLLLNFIFRKITLAHLSGRYGALSKFKLVPSASDNNLTSFQQYNLLDGSEYEILQIARDSRALSAVVEHLTSKMSSEEKRAFLKTYGFYPSIQLSPRLNESSPQPKEVQVENDSTDKNIKISKIDSHEELKNSQQPSEKVTKYGGELIIEGDNTYKTYQKGDRKKIMRSRTRLSNDPSIQNTTKKDVYENGILGSISPINSPLDQLPNNKIAPFSSEQTTDLQFTPNYQY